MNKKGFIHTLEATFAVLIVLSLILILIPREQQEISTPNQLQQAHKTIFNEMSLNSTFRECILSLTTYGKIEDTLDPCIQNSKMADFIKKSTPPRYNHLAEVCDKSTTCTTNLYSILPIDKDVFADSTLIASQPSRIIRVYFWES